MNNKGFFSAITGLIIGFLVISMMVYYVMGKPSYNNSNIINSAANDVNKITEKYTGGNFGLKQYADHDFGFSFWYPGDWPFSEAVWSGGERFPGSVVVKYLKVGKEGSVYVFEIRSKNGKIIDSPGAAPFPPITYSWDENIKTWMSLQTNGSSGQAISSPAVTKDKTMSGLLMLPGNSRFDTSIIPLGPNDFVVVSDGGGANADFLAKTVTRTGESVNSPSQSEALRQEAEAYSAISR